MVLTTDPGSDSAFWGWRTHTLLGLPVPILRTCLQLSSLQWPQLPSLRSPRDSEDIRRGWDPGPLPRCLRDDAEGPGPPSGPEHQARESPRHLAPSHHLPQLRRAHRPHLSPASRIRRPLFTGTPISGNVDLRARDFHGESFYDVPALTADPRFRDSMRLITQYSLLSFMTPWQFYYPRVVLQFYHSMTSRGVSSPLELRFTIDDIPGVLRAAEISAALGLPAELANSGGYRDWPQPSQREMVCCLARDTMAGPVLFRRQLPPQMLLVDHLLRTSLFPLQHYV